MEVVVSCDTAAGGLTLTGKSGPSAYQPYGAVLTGRGPLAAAQCEPGGEVFVGLSVSDEVLAVDVRGAAVVGRVRVGWAPRSLAPVPGTPYLLVANAGSDSLSVVDGQARAEVARFAVGREPGQVAVSADGALAMVCERGAGSVALLDITSLRQGRPGQVAVVCRTRLARHAQPRAAVLLDGCALIAACRLDVLPVIDLADGRIHAQVALPGALAAPAGIALTGEGEYALVTLQRPGTIAVVDLLEGTVTRQIPVGAGPRGITVDPADASVYCALAQAGALAVVHLDGVDLSNTDGQPQYETIPAGHRPSAIALAHTAEPHPAPG
ncbi:YncE family protein [Streptomyces xanthophaeus]